MIKKLGRSLKWQLYSFIMGILNPESDEKIPGKTKTYISSLLLKKMGLGIFFSRKNKTLKLGRKVVSTLNTQRKKGKIKHEREVFYATS